MATPQLPPLYSESKLKTSLEARWHNLGIHALLSCKHAPEKTLARTKQEILWEAILWRTPPCCLPDASAACQSSGKKFGAPKHVPFRYHAHLASLSGALYICTDDPPTLTTPLLAQWIQWLRHTRSDPPTIAEQQLDEIRQAQLKQLAAAADARWAAKPSALDPPPQPEPAPQLQPRDPAANAPQTEPEEREGVRNVAGAPNEVKASMEEQEKVDKGRFKGEKKEKTPSPWDEAKSQEWQPAPWTPKIARRRG